ncbi:MAG: hypothetical protein CVU35_02195 [Betaproteobacteria bacterium HGW-Betaproteobacteria-8]|nr:MAG: hypothetical protein CVU35_02195 [Betaproteobacteria bacterium HGW-Betaproteobacteria-8]
MLAVRTSCAAAKHSEQRREQAEGAAFCFGYFPLGKQRKVTRQSGETDIYNKLQKLQASEGLDEDKRHTPHHD